MNKELFLLTVILLLSTQSAVAGDNVRAITCHGCSASQMAHKATTTLAGGTVYVFNLSSKDVKKYTVYFDADDSGDGRRFSVIKIAEEVVVDPVLKREYKTLVEESQQLQDNVIVAPPDFPVRSAAMGLMGTQFAEGTIANYIENQLPRFQSLNLRTQALLNSAAVKNVPLLDISSLMPSLVIVFQYNDDSTQTFHVVYDIVLDPDGTHGYKIRLTSTGVATTPSGGAVPFVPSDFIGWTVGAPNNNSVVDWLDWARSRGIPVTGPFGSKPPRCPTHGGCYRDPEGKVVCEFTGNGNCD